MTESTNMPRDNIPDALKAKILEAFNNWQIDRDEAFVEFTQQPLVQVVIRTIAVNGTETQLLTLLKESFLAGITFYQHDMIERIVGDK